ncbi:flagellar capping protein [compost metagenome]
MFQIGGIASGLDSTSIIEQLMLLERKPIVSLQNRKTSLTKADSAFQAINTRLNALKSKLSDLTLAKNLSAKSVTSSADTVVTATAGSGAAEGIYKVKVNQLATATTLGSSGTLATAAHGGLKLSELKPANTTAITAGTFTIGAAQVTIHNTDATLDEIMAAINGADADSGNVTVTGASGVTASLADGRIVLDVGGNASVAIGSGADTSNFLTVSGLKSPALDGDLRLGARLNVTQANQKLSSANFGNLSGAGTFSINGVEIAYDADADSLNDVLSRINASKAGVIATYNSLEDRVVLTSKTTGNSAIALSEPADGFLKATNLLGGTQVTGTNARITIEGVNGGSPIESATNEFKDVVPGVTFNAKEVKQTEWTTLTVKADSKTTIDTIKSFINEFNATVDAIESARGKGQPLQNDSTLSGILNRLYRLVYEPVAGLTDGLTTLSSIGIGTTTADRKHLSLNEEKFKEALAASPDRVAELFNKGAAADDPAGIAGRMKAYLDEIGGKEGVFAIRKESTTRQTKYLDDQIESYERRIELRRKKLVTQFSAMEKAVSMMKSQQSAMLSQLSSLQSR